MEFDTDTNARQSAVVVEAYLLERIMGKGYAPARKIIDARKYDPTDPSFWSKGAQERYRVTPLAALTDELTEARAEIARYREALEEVADPIQAMRRRAEAEGSRLSGMAYSISNDIHYVKEIARAALKDPTP